MKVPIFVWMMRLGLFILTVALFSSTINHTWVDLRWVMIKFSDKVAHFMAMFLLTTMSALALPTLSSSMLFLGMILVAGLIEVAQIIGPRSADWFDFLWSCAGILVFAIVFYMPSIQDRLRK